jgi:cyanophycin synthetase
VIAITNLAFFLWRNRFADHPVVVANVNPGSGAEWRFGHLDPQAQRLVCDRFPSLGSGEDDSTAGILASLCLSLQKEKFDLPASAGSDGTRFWFACSDHFYGFSVARFAAIFLDRIIGLRSERPDDFVGCLEQLENGCESAALDQSVRALAGAASARGIPWFRLGWMTRDIQLGYGRKQRRMRETLLSTESVLAVGYAKDKAMTCGLLSAIGLPVGRYASAHSPEQAMAAARAVGFPLVLKPNFGGKGTDVMIGLSDLEAVRNAASRILPRWGQVLIQSFIPGDDHRLLVVSGRLIAAARRERAFVTGDGTQDIQELVDAANSNPRRGKGFRRLMNYIVLDDDVRRVLASQGLVLTSVPPSGSVVRLRLTANISTGATAVDVTEKIHPDNSRLAIRAAQAIGLTVAGIDFITPDIARSWRDVGGAICEVNASVGLRPHWIADSSRDVVGPILESIFTPDDDGRIPTALITGSNGKTTTARMLDHILREEGHVVGTATTDGVTIDGETVAEGDVAGPSGASIVLRDPTVSAAVLETARGGILKRGIYLDRCEVSALLNVQQEQVGIDGIETLDDMARLKRKVIETARRAFVLNAQDPLCMAISRSLPVARTILFSLEASAEDALAHLRAGGTVVTL